MAAAGSSTSAHLFTFVCLKGGQLCVFLIRPAGLSVVSQGVTVHAAGDLASLPVYSSAQMTCMRSAGTKLAACVLPDPHI